MKLLTVTITPYDVNVVPTVLHWEYNIKLSLLWRVMKLAYAVVSVYDMSKCVYDTVDTDKMYVLNKDGDILLSISLEDTPASYDHQLALSV